MKVKRIEKTHPTPSTSRHTKKGVKEETYQNSNQSKQQQTFKQVLQETANKTEKRDRVEISKEARDAYNSSRDER